MQENPDAIGLLPQPFVTVACTQNSALRVALSLSDAWDAAADGASRMVTGVTIVRTEFLQEHPEEVRAFLEDHERSVSYISENLEKTAAYVTQLGIIAAEGVAKQAIPQCSLVCITGEEMREALAGYLSVLYEREPKSIGGALPDEEFYQVLD